MTHFTGLEQQRPVLILTIANGAGHTRVAQGIAAALHTEQSSLRVAVVDVADYMTRWARFTHVTAYLWLVKHAPALWDRIDRFQKKQDHTSPDWYYRHGCRRLFDLAHAVQPCALIATEVGCCEIAALIKRDLRLRAPLIAVSDGYEADSAWVKPEVDLYCFAREELGQELIANGAPPDRVAIWGAPLSEGFDEPLSRAHAREQVCDWLSLDPGKPLVLIAGGGEGMGLIEETTRRLLRLRQTSSQFIVLTGRNGLLKSRCERHAQNGSGDSLRVLGWIGPERMPKLMRAADLMVSKLGSMFNEAIASELPVIALEPPPGSERIQYRLLGEWKVGCAVNTLEQVAESVERLLTDPRLLDDMRMQARVHSRPFAAARIAGWLTRSLEL